MDKIEAIKRFLRFPLKKIDTELVCDNCPFKTEDDACEKCVDAFRIAKKELAKLKNGSYVTEDYIHLMLKKQKVAKAKIDRAKIKSIIFENLYEKEPLYLTIGKATNVSDKLSRAIMSELEDE